MTEDTPTRYKLVLEYDGTSFCGWQRQRDHPSVQETLENALFALTGESPVVAASGRTDSGVHALGQVVSFDLLRSFPVYKLRDGLNFHLRRSSEDGAAICVTAAAAVHPDFHARFSATQREYLYRIVNRRAHLVFDRHRAWLVPQPLDATAMHDAAQVLVGQHDFSSFRAAECQARSPVKTLDSLSVQRVGEEVIIEVKARSFLHHQVRNIVGTLKTVGLGKWTVSDVKRVLAARDRRAGGMTAPAAGLYFVQTRYDGAEAVPSGQK